MIALVGHFHVDQYVAGHKAALGGHLLVAANFNDFFGRDQHFVNLIIQALLFRLLTDRLCDLLLKV